MRNRRKLLAQLHIGAGRLFGITDWSPDGPDAAAIAIYRGWMKEQTGHASAAKAGNAELGDAIRELRRRGALDGRSRGGSGGPDRPTDAQWAKVAALGRARGWHGLDDPRMLGFVVRTAKVSAMRFLTRGQITAVITGLERWAETDSAA